MALPEDTSRKRKAHTKSRQGCGNCKLRRVKCDETKPKCQKCLSFGVSCDYDCPTSDLEVSGVSSFQIEVPKPQAPPTPPDTPEAAIENIIDGMMNAPLYLHVDAGTDGPNVVYIDKPHLDLVRKFHCRSILTIGTVNSVAIYREILTKQAAQHSFILHAVLRFTLMHDRYLYDPIETKPSTAESFHGYHAAALFGQCLAGPIEEEVKDALWGCAALMGAMSFASIEATSPYDAWPLKNPDLTDLDWLKMSDGKKEVWRLTNPMREGSAFKSAVDIEHSHRQKDGDRVFPPHHPMLDRLFPFVTKLYNLDSPRMEDEDSKDPYRQAASILEKLIPLECNHSTIMWFLSFLGHMDPEYRRLLEEKDPSAMLLLAWWYAKLLPYNSWWMARRALLEGQAICIYLDKTLSVDHEIRRLLEFPRQVCGLVDEEKEGSGGGVGEEWPWKRNF